jgi:hypothetical protein
MSMIVRRLLLPILAGAGLAGCVAYQEPVGVGYVPPPPRPYYAPPPVYAAPPPSRVYVRPPPRRQWVPRRCDRYGRCYGGYWR